MADAALYYPYINFRDQRWLNRAVLYWDTLWRMVPAGYEAFDPPNYWPSQGNDLQRLEGEGILRSIAPERVQKQVTGLWTELLEASGGQLEKRFAIDGARARARPSGGYPANPRQRSEPGLADIWAMKMDARLFRKLESLNLARDSRQGWFTLDERLLDAYMTTVANELLGDKQIDTVTDVPAHFLKFESNSLESLQAALLPANQAAATRKARGDDGVLMMTLAVDAVVPAGLEAMSLAQVLKVRKDTEDLRDAFKQSLAAMVDDLQKVRARALDDRVHASDLEKLRKKHIAKPLAELRKAMAGVHGDAVVSVLNLKTGVETGTLAAAMFTLLGPAGLVVAGLAVGGYKVWRETAEARKKLRESPLAWLLAVEKAAKRATA